MRQIDNSPIPSRAMGDIFDKAIYEKQNSYKSQSLTGTYYIIERYGKQMAYINEPLSYKCPLVRINHKTDEPMNRIGSIAKTIKP